MKAKVRLYKWLITAMMFCMAATSFAQNYKLVIQPVDKDENFIAELKLKTSFSNRVQCNQYIQQMPMLLQSKGYLSASVDNVKHDSSLTTIQLFAGEKFVWKQLVIDEKDNDILHLLGFKKDAFTQKPLDANQMHQLQEKLLDFFENNGYPFAKLKFDSVVIDGKEVSAKFTIQKNVVYKFDSIRLFGNAKIEKSFLYHYLNLQPKSLYSKEKLEKINQRLLELPYLQQQQPWSLSMLSTTYLLNLYLQQKRANQVDAIVGFLPANQQLGGKLLFTVDAKINLQNAFATGETIGLNWQQLQPESPKINIIFQRPYIFNSSFGLDFSFDLYKRDSSYLNINANIGLQYIVSAKKKLKLYAQFFKTNMLNVDTAIIIITKKLPDIIDVAVRNLAVEYDYSNTDYKFNPRKGQEFVITASGGTKTINKNSSITQIKDASFDYNSLYDSIQLNTYQLKLKLNAAKYFSVGKQSVFKTALNGGLLQSENYFTNELFQIGGYKLLRGFDEESIFANQYAVGTFEYRYLIGLNSYFFGFTDVGWSNNPVQKTAYNYIGFGLGMAFETKGGIFNISFAEGKRNDLPLNFKQSKIHIGFVSIF
jgi:outer membrane protein assembly factor BamA